MIKDYQPFLDQVKNAVSPIGFNLAQESDFEATFLNDEGWSISLEGERYVRPAFKLSIGINGLSFSVSLLMEVFNINEKPSLTEQLKFINEKYKKVFVFPPSYLTEYEKANEIDI